MKSSDKIAEIVKGISATLIFTRVETVGLNCRYYTCKTSYALVGREIDLGFGPTIILAVEPDKYIEVLSPDPCVFYPSGVLQYELYFFHGTVVNTNNELTGIQDSENKVPMVYLLEPYEDKIYHNHDSIFDRVTSCHLFFLSWSNYWDWQTKQHHEFVLDPMETLAATFMDTAKELGLVQDVPQYTQSSRVNFGVYKRSEERNRTTTGADKRKFNDQLSGIEIKAELSFLAAEHCCSTF